MDVRKIKSALKRKDDGTPVGHPAPCYFDCPKCGCEVPAYDRQGRALHNGYGVLKCDNCHECMNMDGYSLI